MTEVSQFCSVDQLESLVESGGVKVLDCSWYLPSQSINTENQFKQQHIPGAQFFHIDQICDQNSTLPHMLPGADDFSKAVAALGISNDSHVVVYDSAGLFSAARVWWTFKVFGHQNVQVLDGGLPAWSEQGGALESNTRAVIKTDYVATLNSKFVINKHELIENISSKQYRVLDARSKERFLGQAPEPRAGLPSGHMPESVCMSFANLIENGRLKSRQQLRVLFDQVGINQSTKIVTSCGSGVTAAIITLALVECGYGINRLYDGSWSEWASADDTVILNRSL
jgi:thiosulfate/3-mercaptopyruvate sulfurtransferase